LQHAADRESARAQAFRQDCGFYAAVVGEWSFLLAGAASQPTAATGSARRSCSEGNTLVNISKDQIVQLLESQGNHDHAQQAKQQLPDQIDTDNAQHAGLLSKFGLDTSKLGGLLGGLGNVL
jgi:hypothetical protein